ncbi:Uncharacterised protein [uncultured archaeon]|nr:Uncharacterised protein [uncultured archaeon]
MEELSSKFGILAEISEKFPKNKKPVLVGGSAVEFYTRGTCKSIDIDVLGDRDSLEKVLEKMGFSKTGRHWFYTKEIGIEIVGDSTEGRRVNEILHEGKLIRILSIEDLIVERLNACKHWKSQYDCEQAQVLAGAYSDKLDREYLRKRMKEEDLEMELIKI